MSAPSVIERVKTTLVALKMPRALEVLTTSPCAALSAAKSAPSRPSTPCSPKSLPRARPVASGMAVQMARLSAIKTLAGFDFAFQPSLERNRILALAVLQFIDRAEAVHLSGPPGPGKTSSEPCPRRRGGQSRPQRLLQLARRHRRHARQGRTRRRSSRQDPLLLPLRAAHRRRVRLPPRHGGRRQSLLPARQRPIRKGRDDPHFKPRLRRMGRHLRRFLVVATALLDRLLHHAVVVQIEGRAIGCASTPTCCPETVRFKPHRHRQSIPPTLKHRGRPAKKRREPITHTADGAKTRQTGEFCGATFEENRGAIDTASRFPRRSQASTCGSARTAFESFIGTSKRNGRSVTAGVCRITILDQLGRPQVADVPEGGLWYFPAGLPHSLQGLEPDGSEFVLAFDNGESSEFNTLLVTDWIAHTPAGGARQEFWPVGGGVQEYIPVHNKWIYQSNTPTPPLAEVEAQMASTAGEAAKSLRFLR